MAEKRSYSISPKRRPVPFVLVAPAAVLILGTLVVFTMSILGFRELEARAKDAGVERAALLAQLVTQRFDGLDAEERRRVLDEASRRSSSTFLILRSDGSVGMSVPPGTIDTQALDVLRNLSPGSIPSVAGKVGFVFALRDDGQRLIVLSPELEATSARSNLFTSILLFAGLVIGASAFVAWTLARDVQADVLYLRKLIVELAQDGSTEARLIPVRTIDQVGQLTASFNVLLERFYAAEKAYQADLSRANAFDKDRSAFLSALSHELRTPLNGILGFTDILLSELDGPLSDEARENLTVVRTSAEHLRSLIDDILAYSAIELGEFRLSREKLDLYKVAHEVVTEASVTANTKGIYLKLSKDENHGPLVLDADRRRLRQVLQNLVSNAVKFTTNGGVEVHLTRTSKELEITVQDTGPGIHEDDIEDIFKEFAQATAGAAHKTGTGLGLAITERLVRLHGGTVQVRSSFGSGSIFIVRLPIETDAPPRPEEGARSTPTSSAFDPKT